MPRVFFILSFFCRGTPMVSAASAASAMALVRWETTALVTGAQVHEGNTQVAAVACLHI